MSLTVHKKKCPVCNQEFQYVDVRNVPKTCYKKMCVANYNAHLNRMTPEGQSPSIQRINSWNSYQSREKSTSQE